MNKHDSCSITAFASIFETMVVTYVTFSPTAIVMSKTTLVLPITYYLRPGNINIVVKISYMHQEMKSTAAVG